MIYTLLKNEEFNYAKIRSFMRNKWTKEELDFIKDNYKNMNDNELSSYITNHTPDSIAVKRRRLGLVKPKLKHSFNDVLLAFQKTNYILLSDESDFKDMAANTLRYICPKHKDKGVQTISLGHLESGRGCYWCGREVTENAHKNALDDCKIKEDKILCERKGFKYIDSKMIDGKANIGFICPNHSKVGIQYMTRGNMKRENIIGCKYCLDKKKYKYSKGEKKIKDYLDANNYVHIDQYTSSDCRDKTYLPFDFYLPNKNIIIEYDGQHHFKPVTFNGISNEEALKNHKTIKYHDELKNEYCKNNGINLIRIPYWEFKNIDLILKEKLA